MTAIGFAAIGIGAALGAWLRWLLGVGLNAIVPELPFGTLLANLVGGYLIGVAVAVLDDAAGFTPELRLFVITGFLGGLTTYSTFSAESVSLISSGRYGWAIAHTGAHLAGSIALTALGMMSVRMLRT